MRCSTIGPIPFLRVSTTGSELWDQILKFIKDGVAGTAPARSRTRDCLTQSQCDDRSSAAATRVGSTCSAGLGGD